MVQALGKEASTLRPSTSLTPHSVTLQRGGFSLDHFALQRHWQGILYRNADAFVNPYQKLFS